MLSPDFGDQTSLPSCQVSQGLGSFPSDTFVPPEACSPPPLAPSIVFVNVMWLLSLVLCIASALLATLKQQRAHGYIRLPQVAMTVLLHFSIFLFLVGLVIYFFTIYKTVAIVVSITVRLFVMIYLTLTIGPCLLASVTCAHIVPHCLACDGSSDSTSDTNLS